MGAAGSPYAAFQRAMKAGNVTLALAEARDLPKLNLADSLALLVLIAEKEPRLYERAAVRFAGRYLLEHKGATLRDGAFILALLADVGETGDGPAALRLRQLVERRQRR
jgi:hypothetical protein